MNITCSGHAPVSALFVGAAAEAWRVGGRERGGAHQLVRAVAQPHIAAEQRHGAEPRQRAAAQQQRRARDSRRGSGLDRTSDPVTPGGWAT